MKHIKPRKCENPKFDGSSFVSLDLDQLTNRAFSSETSLISANNNKDEKSIYPTSSYILPPAKLSQFFSIDFDSTWNEVHEKATWS